MPGAYTHISLVRLLTSGVSLEKSKLPQDAINALMGYPEFCHLGSISPDYPYLNILKDREISGHWANAMHHKYGTLTERNILHVGISYLKRLSKNKKAKCLSWLLGYSSHIVADVTCHPVTNLLVGDYAASNKDPHRQSEMHQDAYIFQTRLQGNVSRSEHIKNVIGSCEDPENREKIDPDIEKMWRHLLQKTFPQLYQKFDIYIHDWHRAVQFFIDDLAEELSFIPSRHVQEFFDKKGISYPRFEDIETKFLKNLKTPKGKKSYDQIFDKAKSNVAKIWKLISDAIYKKDAKYKDKIKIWELDTGQEAKTPKVMWGDKV